MKRVIYGYEPDMMFRYFEEISAIPRGSGKEEKIVCFLEEFAKQNKLDYVRDSYNNILIRKGATDGYEKKLPVLLQGHTDMVCEKDSGVVHDFEKEGLRLQVENGILSAAGTTLGGDDGTAVAMMMAILTDDKLEHPALECLFTSDEEVGMSGAAHFDYSQIRAERMINLDSEAEGEATVSCAGGARAKLTFPIERVRMTGGGKLLSVHVSGLAGGHSGSDIHLQKTNADIALARILSAVYAQTPMNLISISGGTKDNAIPRESEAVFFTTDPADAEKVIKDMTKVILAEQIKPDLGFRVRIGKPSEAPFDGIMTYKDTHRVLDAILLAPNGMMTRCPENFDLVETSSNLGILVSEEKSVSMTYLCRSSVESRMDELLLKYERLAELLGCEYSTFNRYPGWALQSDSQLQRDFVTVCREVLGGKTEPKITAIHAGLECGLIISAVSHPLDAISIGPELHDIHTPKETLELDSYERLWKIVSLLLKM